METETKAAFARRLALSKPRISQLVKRGLPVNPDGSIPVAEALRWFRANVAPHSGPASADPGVADLATEKARLTSLQADRAALELAARRGELIDRDGAKRAIVAFARLYRDYVLNFASRQGPALAAEWGIDARVVVAGLDAELRKMLVELSREPMPKLGDDE